MVRFRQIGPSIHRGSLGDGGSFRQQIKRLAQGCGQLSAFPRAVRNSEIEQTTFFARFLLLEKPLCVARQFEKPYPFFEVGLIGALVLFDLAHATILLSAPLTGTNSLTVGTSGSASERVALVIASGRGRGTR